MGLIKINSSKTNWGDEAASLNQNFDRVSVSIEQIKNATTRLKGYFMTSAVLKEKHPNAQAGDVAYVGGSFPYKIWRWGDNGWYETVYTIEGEQLRLDNYYTKEEADDAFVKYRVFDGGRADTLYGGARTLNCGGADAYLD